VVVAAECAPTGTSGSPTAAPEPRRPRRQNRRRRRFDSAALERSFREREVDPLSAPLFRAPVLVRYRINARVKARFVRDVHHTQAQIAVLAHRHRYVAVVVRMRQSAHS
jgi:hypothetical protein